MSITGIASSGVLQNYNLQSRLQQFKTEFQQLGQDLQAGDLSKAQADFATLTQNSTQNPTAAQNPPASQQTGNSPLSQAVSALASDLQSGNLAAAQQDFAQLQQALPQDSGQPVRRHHHHHAADSSIAQAFRSLAQDLGSGNLSSAQQAYQTIQQELGQGTQNGSASSGSTTSTSA